MVINGFFCTLASRIGIAPVDLKQTVVSSFSDFRKRELGFESNKAEDIKVFTVIVAKQSECGYFDDIYNVKIIKEMVKIIRIVLN